MSNSIRDLNPKALWNNFADICAIPHPSKKEEKIIAYAKDFGEKLGLKTVVDELGNVIIRKPATPGMENRKMVCLQGHLDMVPQANSSTQHNFETDPIQAYVDGEWVRAKDTTLGADNGIGVAAALSVLQATDLEHGPIEVLLTVDEETGLTGAFGLKPDVLKGDILINMDSEDEGELYVGCAGGVNTNVKIAYKEETAPADSKAYELNVSGLKGGHSGMDIALGRGNSNKLMNRLLWKAARNYGLRLAAMEGGNLRNAIPRECVATVYVPSAKADEFEAYVNDLDATVRNELKGVDAKVQIKATATNSTAKVMDTASQEKLLNAIHACPHGVIGMSNDMPGLVETSTNLAVVNVQNGQVEILTSQRSSTDSAKLDLMDRLHAIFEPAGGEIEHSSEYPGWKPNLDSPILATMKEVYQQKYGRVPEVKAIHAGLECGLLGGTYPNMDMISFGPTINNPHSPDEEVNIETVQKFWDFLVETLKNVPAK